MTIYSCNFLLLPCQVDGPGPQNANTLLGAEDEPRLNMPQWHIDYFELKLRNSQCKRGTLTLLSVFLKAENKSPLSKLYFLHLDLKGNPCHQNREFKLRRLYEQNTLFLDLPSNAQLCLDASLFEYLKSKFLCVVTPSQIKYLFV